MSRYTITQDAVKDIVDRLEYLAYNLKSPYTRSEMRDIIHSLKTSLFLENSNISVPDNTPELIKQGQSVPSKFLVAIGQASVCWKYPERAGRFDSEQAIKIARDLYNHVREEYV